MIRSGMWGAIECGVTNGGVHSSAISGRLLPSRALWWPVRVLVGERVDEENWSWSLTFTLLAVRYRSIPKTRCSCFEICLARKLFIGPLFPFVPHAHGRAFLLFSLSTLPSGSPFSFTKFPCDRRVRCCTFRDGSSPLRAPRFTRPHHRHLLQSTRTHAHTNDAGVRQV